MVAPTLIGYQRVSTDDQKLELQRDALLGAGVHADRVYEDKLSGAKVDRPGLEHAIRACREGDILVVWRLDYLGRSLKDLIAIVERLEGCGVGLRSLHESIDTTTASGDSSSTSWAPWPSSSATSSVSARRRAWLLPDGGARSQVGRRSSARSRSRRPRRCYRESSRWRGCSTASRRGRA